RAAPTSMAVDSSTADHACTATNVPRSTRANEYWAPVQPIVISFIVSVQPRDRDEFHLLRATNHLSSRGQPSHCLRTHHVNENLTRHRPDSRRCRIGCSATTRHRHAHAC